MGATWISWRTTTTVIIIILQFQALITVKTKPVASVEGQRFNFRRDYPDDRPNNATAKYPENLVHYTTVSPIFPKDHTVDKLNLPLYLTAVMFVAAIVCVCLFTFCLLLAVKQQSRPRQDRETSSDYETMMPGVVTEPELCCTCPDCADLSALPPPPPDLCSHSTVTVGLSEHVDVDIPGHICPYQHLDRSRLEEHIYHSLHGNSGLKDKPLGVKQQNKC